MQLEVSVHDIEIDHNYIHKGKIWYGELGYSWKQNAATGIYITTLSMA